MKKEVKGRIMDKALILATVATLMMAALPLAIGQGLWRTASDYNAGPHSWAYAWVGAWFDPGTMQFLIPADHAGNSGHDPGWRQMTTRKDFNSPTWCSTLVDSYIYYSAQGWVLDCVAYAAIY